jgi:hypothetical protein
MLDSTKAKDGAKTKEKPCDVDAMDAVERCKRAVGMLHCIVGAAHLDIDNKEDALAYVTYHLNDQVHTLRAYFEMDKKEGVSC